MTGLSEQSQILLLREELKPLVTAVQDLGVQVGRINGRVERAEDDNTAQGERLLVLEGRVGDTRRMKLIERERNRNTAAIAFGVSGVVSLITMLIVVFFVV